MLFFKKQKRGDASTCVAAKVFDMLLQCLLCVCFCELVEIEVEVTQLSAEGANL